MISERDLLGTQVIRRNDELALLYEKLKIQESTLHKGEAQYLQRVEDIRILKLEIKKMRRERNMLSKNVSNVEDLRCLISEIEHFFNIIHIFYLDVSSTTFRGSCYARGRDVKLWRKSLRTL